MVDQAALGPALATLSGSWVAQPDLTAFGEGDLVPVSAKVAALAPSLLNSTYLNGAQLVTSLPLAVLLVIAVAAVAYEVRAVRGRGVAATLRM